MSTKTTHSTTPSSFMSTMACRRKDSDEIDVFEAARYFSGGTDGNVSVRSVVGVHGRMREERLAWRPLRKSLDMPIGTMMISQPPTKVDKQCIQEKKNSKQPSSPGGRLASFLNSLFNQVASKVKVKSKSSSSSTKDDIEENCGGRSRSSISHSPSLTVCTSTKGYKVISDEKKRLAPKVVMEKKEVLKDYGENDDGESDSSSDLFELKNYELGDDHVSSGLPVYGATNMKAIKRDATIAS